jgi:RNA polymerase sigma factor (sigma-70 family)
VANPPAVRSLTAPFVIHGARPAPAQGSRSSSFDRLFTEEYARVVGIAQRVLADPVAAEDVAQEVFLDLHRRFGDEPGPSAAAWLRAAAVHTALNTIRTERRRAARENREVPVPVSAEDPQIAAEVAERRRALRAALARIPKRHATVLVLRYGGLSYAEIASALGVGINSVGTRLRRAETCLRKEVGDAPV